MRTGLPCESNEFRKSHSHLKLSFLQSHFLSHFSILPLYLCTGVEIYRAEAFGPSSLVFF